MYALTYTFLFILAAFIPVVLKLLGITHLGWFWLYLSFAGVMSLVSGAILIIFWLREQRATWPPQEKGKKLEPLPHHPASLKKMTGKKST